MYHSLSSLKGAIYGNYYKGVTKGDTRSLDPSSSVGYISILGFRV